jgi:hypothetical protein
VGVARCSEAGVAFLWHKCDRIIEPVSPSQNYRQTCSFSVVVESIIDIRTRTNKISTGHNTTLCSLNLLQSFAKRCTQFMRPLCLPHHKEILWELKKSVACFVCVQTRRRIMNPTLKKFPLHAHVFAQNHNAKNVQSFLHILYRTSSFNSLMSQFCETIYFVTSVLLLDSTQHSAGPSYS